MCVNLSSHLSIYLPIYMAVYLISVYPSTLLSSALRARAFVITVGRINTYFALSSLFRFITSFHPLVRAYNLNTSCKWIHFEGKIRHLADRDWLVLAVNEFIASLAASSTCSMYVLALIGSLIKSLISLIEIIFVCARTRD